MQQIFSFSLSASILIFGYFIPALSSVKAVVRKDIIGAHHWCTYWFILHLYTTILSPLLHLTLHPLFQLLAILWLSLPRYQGASVVYDRIVVPWVDKHETQVDNTLDEAHRGMRRYVMEKLKTVIWAVMGEGGSLAEILIQGVIGSTSSNFDDSNSVSDTQSNKNSMATSSHHHPRHSVKEALCQNSSGGDSMNDEQSFDENLVQDFMSMLVQGLYVFANVEKITGSDEQIIPSHTGFKLGVFSFVESDFTFVITSPSGRDQQQQESVSERLLIDNLTRISSSGPQGIVLDFSSNTRNEPVIRAEIVLSDESDRDILLNGLSQCLPIIKGG